MIKFFVIIFILLIIYQINIKNIKGGHYIDRKIRDSTIFPIINYEKLINNMGWLIYKSGAITEAT